MAKQFAVLGLGNFGFSLAVTLEQLGCEVIAVDISEDTVQKIADQVSYAMCADIHDEELLTMLGTKNLDGVIVAISESLEVSILATLKAKELGAPFVMAKAQSDIHADILRKLGADSVVFPERQTGIRLAKTIATKNFADWIELSPEYSMVEAPVPEAWIGKSLRELDVRNRIGVNIVGVIREEGVNINMEPDEQFKAGDLTIIIGENKILNEFSKGKME